MCSILSCSQAGVKVQNGVRALGTFFWWNLTFLALSNFFSRLRSFSQVSTNFQLIYLLRTSRSHLIIVFLFSLIPSNSTKLYTWQNILNRTCHDVTQTAHIKQFMKENLLYSSQNRLAMLCAITLKANYL